MPSSDQAAVGLQCEFVAESVEVEAILELFRYQLGAHFERIQPSAPLYAGHYLEIGGIMPEARVAEDLRVLVLPRQHTVNHLCGCPL